MHTPLRIALLAIAICASLFLAVGRATASTARHARTSHATTVGVRAVGFARSLLGVRYVWGGASPRSGFDCSGFVRYVYGHFGVRLAHSSFAQFTSGFRVNRGALKPGDLVFFHGLGHVGIYIGNDEFVHASSRKRGVRVDSLNTPYYNKRFVKAVRLKGCDEGL